MGIKDEIRVTGFGVMAIIIAHGLMEGPLYNIFNRNWMITVGIGVVGIFIIQKLANKVGN